MRHVLVSVIVCLGLVGCASITDEELSRHASASTERLDAITGTYVDHFGADDRRSLWHWLCDEELPNPMPPGERRTRLTQTDQGSMTADWLVDGVVMQRRELPFAYEDGFYKSGIRRHVRPATALGVMMVLYPLEYVEESVALGVAPDGSLVVIGKSFVSVGYVLIGQTGGDPPSAWAVRFPRVAP